MNLTYRLAAPADFDFLFGLHKAAMQKLVEATFGSWDEPWQLAYFRRHFDPLVQRAELRVIQLDGQDVGLLHVQERAEELFIASLEILPERQGQGIGSAVVREVLRAAATQAKPVALQVLKANIAARSLYQRLGFGITGENETHYILAWEKSPRA